MEALTLRQAECVKLRKEGLSWRQIAKRLGIHHMGVKRHFHRAQVKMGLKPEPMAAVQSWDPRALDNLDPEKVAAVV